MASLLERLFPSPAPLPPAGMVRVIRASEMVVKPPSAARGEYVVADTTLGRIHADVQIHGPTTCAAVAARLGLSPSTVSSGLLSLEGRAMAVRAGRHGPARLWKVEAPHAA